MRLEFDLAGSQIEGARDYQEDAFLITHLADTEGNPSSLIIVADGMGGHAAGNVASNMAVQAFNKHVSSHYPTLAVSKILEEAIEKANLSIRETIEETPALQGMGCTMVGAILEKGKIWWASVGDSHLYLVRESGIAKINEDHSYGGFIDRMEAEGKFVEPDPGLTRNMLMSAITGEEVNEIDCPNIPRELYPEDRVLICTDGMDTLSNGQMLEFLANDSPPKQCVDELIKAVENAEMPRQDNTTAVVVRVSGEASVKNKEPLPEKQATADQLDMEDVREILEGDESPSQDAATDRSSKESLVENRYDFPKDSSASESSKLVPMLFSVLLLAALGVGGYFFWFKKDSGIATDPVVDNTMESEWNTGMEPLPEESMDSVDEETIADEPDFDEPEELADSEQDSALEEETGLIDQETAEEMEEVVEEAPEPEVVVPVSVETFSDNLRVGGRGPTMVKLPSGSYKMGNSNTTRYATEQPVHPVNVTAFAISQYEITFADYDRFARSTGRGLPNSRGLNRSKTPVFNISWNDAKQYADWLSKQTGHEYSLPTEAQWEYAATAGTKDPYPWGFDEIEGYAHCITCGAGLTTNAPTDVGSYAPNAFGLYDMNGNVAEWTQECWHPNYRNAPETDVSWSGGDCSYRVVRGGAYSSPQSSLRNQRRDKYGAKSRYDNIGIRVVRKLP